ncbi:MAG TPA: IPT/TIG domain-containing protein [Verrucomicrobiae bacterium]|nr:IPT/TIG domain-containing protein [Verrucomicrobiae bacterium]
MIRINLRLGTGLVFGLLAPLALTLCAQDLPVYTDALQNGLEDWSWATVDLANATPVHSGAASIKVSAKAWEAFRVHAPTPLTTAAYSTLTFWVNGGAAGGQPLSLQATVNGNAQTAVDLGAAPANSWKQYTISMTALGIAAQPNFDGFWIQNNSPTDLSASPFFIDDITLTAAAGGGGGGGGGGAGLSVGSVVSDNGLAARLVQWTDAAGQPRKAVMVDQRPEGAGYLRQLTYRVNGADRVCTGTGDNGHMGDGYVQNHTAYGGDNSSHTTPGTTTVLLAGAHHAIVSYDMPAYKIDGQTVPTTIQWFFADGRSHPIFAISQDARATAGNLAADTRSPYGDVAYDGGLGATVGGGSFGDTYKFATLASAPEQVTRASGWRYDEPNTIPYAMQWTDPSQVDAEMGHVATVPISVQDQGSDSRTSPIVDNRGMQAPNGPMIDDENWSYQILNYVMPANGPTGSKRLTWGSNWGRPGGFDNWGSRDAQNNPLSQREYSQHSTDPLGQALGGARADGMLSAYSVFVVLGTHSGGYKAGTVGQMVTQMENAARASLSAAVGTLKTSGPAGVGNASSATVTYTPAGYNPVYSTWEVVALGNAVNATLTPAAGDSLDHPMFVVNNYTLGQLPGSISVGAGLSTPDVDYLATLDTANQRLWITVNRSVNAPLNLVVTAAGAPPPAPVINSIPAGGVVGTSVIITGNNFSGATAVKFNGTTASFTVDSPTQITAVVPVGATAGLITVTTPGGTAASATNFTPTVAPGIVHLNLDANLAVRTVDARWFGVNVATWDANLGAPETVSLLSEMGCQILRYPGGAESDDYHWDANHADTTTFASVTAGAGAQAVITVNYGSGTPQEAAAWVKFCNVNNNYGFKYWEIGNENYGFWEKDNNANPHDPYTYAVRAKDYIQQMKAVDPTIKIGVPVVIGEDTPSWDNYKDHPAVNALTGQTHYGWTPVMLATLKGLGVAPDFLVYHRYPEDTEAGQPSPDNDATLLQTASGWANDAADLRGQITAYFGAGGQSIELLCTENNSDSGLQGKQSTSLVNGLYYADSLGQLMLTEFNGFLWWDFRNGTEKDGSFDPALYGWRDYGDFGMVNGLNTRHPTFYAAKLMHQFASSGDTIVRVASDNPLVAAYAAKRVNGNLSLLLINKDPNDNSLTAQISINGFMPQAGAAVLSYGTAQDNAARDNAAAQAQDIAASSFNGAAAGFSYTLPALSLTLLTLSPALPPAPVIAGIPAGGTVGTSIVITGNNFIGTTAVLFNGVSATFTVDSSTQITAVVPVGASSGPITVTTPSGSTVSAANFTPVTAAPPPTLAIKPAVASSGLRIVSGPGLYDRQNIATDTTANDYGWVGSAAPVSYSLTISDFPAQGYLGFQAHMFLVPNSTGLTDPDYDEPTVVMLDIQSHADGSASAWLRYKIGQPADNSFLYADGTLGQVNCTTGPLGTWTVTFTSDTAISLNAPDGTTTQLSFPDAAAAKAAFGAKVTAYFGNQANDASQVGQSTTFSRIKISGTPGAAAIDETFPGPDLNQHPTGVSWQWVKPAAAPAGISIASTAGLLLSWGLPDTGYILRSSPSLAAPAWSQVDLSNAVILGSSRQLFIPNWSLPGQTSAFFRLVKLP